MSLYWLGNFLLIKCLSIGLSSDRVSLKVVHGHRFQQVHHCTNQKKMTLPIRLQESWWKLGGKMVHALCDFKLFPLSYCYSYQRVCQELHSTAKCFPVYPYSKTDLLWLWQTMLQQDSQLQLSLRGVVRAMSSDRSYCYGGPVHMEFNQFTWPYQFIWRTALSFRLSDCWRRQELVQYLVLHRCCWRVGPFLIVLCAIESPISVDQHVRNVITS